MLETLNN